jgi:HD-GYP domain-containing protein (c-di-GMP phosphodiesterase class II)
MSVESEKFYRFGNYQSKTVDIPELRLKTIEKCIQKASENPNPNLVKEHMQQLYYLNFNFKNRINAFFEQYYESYLKEFGDTFSKEEIRDMIIHDNKNEYAMFVDIANYKIKRSIELCHFILNNNYVGFYNSLTFEELAKINLVDK